MLKKDFIPLYGEEEWKKRIHGVYKHHYIYKITCLCGNLKGYYYIGKHSTTKADALEDGYYGGGVIINKYYKKYPPVQGETIIKEILEYNDSVETNSTREKEIIGNLWKTDPLCLNKKKGGEGGNGHANAGRKHTKEEVEQHAARLKEYYKTHRGPNTGNGTMVECYDDNGDFVGRFDTQELAGRVFGKSPINWGLREENHKEAGFRWRVAEGMFAPIKESIGVYEKPKRVMPPEAIEKIKKSKEGIIYPSKRKAVIGINDEGEVVKADCTEEAAIMVHPKNVKAATKNIQANIMGRRRIAYGYKWSYQ